LRCEQREDRLHVGVPDISGNISAKTIGAFRHVLAHHHFDYLFRTNTSS